MLHAKRKVAKGYSGRLLGAKTQSLSRLKQEDSNGNSSRTSESAESVKPLERKKTMKSNIFTLFPDRRSSPHRITSKPRHWTSEEDQLLREAVRLYGEKKWKQIAAHVPNRNHTQCLQRWSKVLAPGLKKGQWGREEDTMLIKLVTEELRVAKIKKGKPKINWGKVSRSIQGRTAKQCRERWVNNLDPEITKAPWTEDEDTLLLMLQERYPKRWAMISKYLPGRTENAVKIRFKSLTRNVKTEAEKDELRALITRCTVEEQIEKVKSQSLKRRMKEKSSLKERIVRIGSGMFSSFTSRRSNYNLKMNAVEEVPLTTHELLTPTIAPNMNYQCIPGTPITEYINNVSAGFGFPDVKLDDSFSYNSELRRSSRNLNDLIYGKSSAFQKADGSFRKKRRASTTTSTVNNTNLSFTDVSDQNAMSHLNLFSSVTAPMSLEKTCSDRSIFKDLLLPVHDTPRVSSKRNLLLQQQQQGSDRSIDMNECLRLLSGSSTSPLPLTS